MCALCTNILFGEIINLCFVTLSVSKFSLGLYIFFFVKKCLNENEIFIGIVMKFLITAFN